MTNVGFLATQIYSRATAERDEIEAEYERSAEPVFFSCMIDLVKSSEYRVRRGARAGYIRGETFFSLVRNAIEANPDIRLIKEMGDAVLLIANTFRPLFEGALLIDHVAFQLNAIAGEDDFPFAVRMGISFGASKKLMRRAEDYLGRSIDELARIMSIRSSCNFHVHEKAFDAAKDQIPEYSPVARVGEMQLLQGSLAKGASEPIYYREVVVDRKALQEFTGYFSMWRKRPARR